MSETRSLITGLQLYLAALEMLLLKSAEYFSALERRWGALNEVYDGVAADQFRAGWLQTTQRFRDYVEGLRRISALLSERVQHLEEYDRPLS